MFCRLQFIDQRWFPSSLSCHIAWLELKVPNMRKYGWRTSCGTILGNFRETTRKKFDWLYYNFNIVLLVLVEFWMRFVRMESVRLAFKFGGWEPTRQVSFWPLSYLSRLTLKQIIFHWFLTFLGTAPWMEAIKGTSSLANSTPLPILLHPSYVESPNVQSV